MKPGLRTTILFIATIIMMVAMVANALTSSYFFTQKQTESHLMWAGAIARVLGGQLERILFLGIPIKDLQGFERQCNEAVTLNRDLSYAYVIAEDGTLLFHNAQAEGVVPAVPEAVLAAVSAGKSIVEHLEDDSHAVTVPVMDPHGVRVAHVVIGFPHEVIVEARTHLLTLTTSVDLLVLALTMVLLVLALGRFVIRPLTVMVSTLESIRPGGVGYTRRLDEPGSKELNVVASAFNRLLERLGEHEAELVAAKEAAERANRAKSDFLAVMSHEIRTPMHAMLGMTEMIASTPLDDRQRTYVGRLLRSGRALLSIINDILDFSRIDSNQTDLEDIAFDLRTPFKDVVDTLSVSAADKGLSLTLESPSIPLGVRGDPVRLQQVAMNLVSNAIKFTERGAITVRVNCKDFEKPGSDGRSRLLTLEVIDTGVGILPEVREQIFKPFCQADNSITRRYGGSGLGLTIVERIVKLMKGEISVQSTPGEGSRFAVTIPFPAADVPPAEQSAPVSQTDAALTGARVLLVEDDPVNQEVAHAMLEHSGVIVTVANNGQEAVEALARGVFDIVFMDCHMPVCDGFEATRRIRQAETPGTHLPIIALTADILPETRQRCRSVGMDDFLTKPFTQHAMLSTIGRWTGGRVGSARDEPTAPPVEDSPPLFDPAPLETLAAIAGSAGSSVIEKLLELFLGGLDDLIAGIARAKAQADSASLRALAHQLKSSSANVGAAKLSSCAAALEAAVRNEAHSADQARLADALIECALQTAGIMLERLESCRQRAADAGEARAAGPG
ncbi:MAG: ATP-binding protein [Thauera sp.]